MKKSSIFKDSLEGRERIQTKREKEEEEGTLSSLWEKRF